MSDVRHDHTALIERILDGEGTAPREQRRAAFDNRVVDEPLAALVRKVAERAHAVSDRDVADVRAAGLTEEQIFELVVCAAVGQATRQLQAGLAALDAAVGD